MHPEKFEGESKVLDQILGEKLINSKHNDVEQWRIQGVKFLKQKYFAQAIKCFTYSGDQSLVDRCNAFKLAEEAQ